VLLSRRLDALARLVRSIAPRLRPRAVRLLLIVARPFGAAIGTIGITEHRVGAGAARVGRPTAARSRSRPRRLGFAHLVGPDHAGLDALFLVLLAPLLLAPGGVTERLGGERDRYQQNQQREDPFVHLPSPRA
jgi:hypothetical protein